MTTFSRTTSLICVFVLGFATLLVQTNAGVISKSRWDRDFKFGSNDSLKIQVFKVKDEEVEKTLDQTFRLTGSGYATIEGTPVKIGGLNMFSALASIESALRRSSAETGLELKAQIVTRNGVGVVFVDGQVQRPGIVEVKDEATLKALVAAAGGVTNSADLNRVTVFVDGRTKLIDVPAVGGAENVIVKPGSVVKIVRGLLQGDKAIERRFDQLGEGGNPMGDRLKGL